MREIRNTCLVGVKGNGTWYLIENIYEPILFTMHEYIDISNVICEQLNKIMTRGNSFSKVCITEHYVRIRKIITMYFKISNYWIFKIKNMTLRYFWLEISYEQFSLLLWGKFFSFMWIILLRDVIGKTPIRTIFLWHLLTFFGLR